jgi:hypothetical protein
MIQLNIVIHSSTKYTIMLNSKKRTNNNNNETVIVKYD